MENKEYVKECGRIAGRALGAYVKSAVEAMSKSVGKSFFDSALVAEPVRQNRVQVRK